MFSERMKIRVPVLSAPTNAMVRPSGEIAGVSSTVVPGGALIDSANADATAAGRRVSAHVQSAPPQPASR